MTIKKLSLADGIASLDSSADVPFTLLEAGPDITIVLYKPQRPDRQTPHGQDEYYFVTCGSGAIRVNGEVTTLDCGDAVFVPALAEHAFTDTSEDFACWAVFYGPDHSDGAS